MASSCVLYFLFSRRNEVCLYTTACDNVSCMLGKRDIISSTHFCHPGSGEKVGSPSLSPFQYFIVFFNTLHPHCRFVYVHSP